MTVSLSEVIRYSGGVVRVGVVGCRYSGESVDHLLLHFTAAFKLWRNWAGKHLSDIWNLVQLFLMWTF